MAEVKIDDDAMLNDFVEQVYRSVKKVEQARTMDSAYRLHTVIYDFVKKNAPKDVFKFDDSVIENIEDYEAVKAIVGEWKAKHKGACACLGYCTFCGYHLCHGCACKLLRNLREVVGVTDAMHRVSLFIVRWYAFDMPDNAEILSYCVAGLLEDNSKVRKQIARWMFRNSDKTRYLLSL